MAENPVLTIPHALGAICRHHSNCEQLYIKTISMSMYTKVHTFFT
jgi:hypothetical protein